MPKISTLKEIREAKERADAATPGPLAVGRADGQSFVRRIFRDEQDLRCTQFLAVCSSASVDNHANAELFAASRTDVPDLAHTCEELYARLKRRVEQGHAVQCVTAIKMACDCGLAEDAAAIKGMEGR